MEKRFKYWLFSIFLLGTYVSCKEESMKEIPPDKVSIIQRFGNPSGVNASLPRLFSNGESLFFSWVEKKDSITFLFYSELKTAWTGPKLLAQGSDWFVNWADFPQIAENNGALLNSYLQKSSGDTYAYDIRLNYYNPRIERWTKGYLLNNDSTKTEHGFVSMQPYGATDFFVSWLDGRKTGGGEGHDHHGNGAMTLRAAFIDSLGKVYNEKEIDARVCDCCNTASAVTDNGLVVAYRNRSETEIRDINVIRYSDSLWQKPITLGNDEWEIAGCPVNGPSIDGNGKDVIVAWFTGVHDEGKVQVAWSKDEGASFGDPLRIDHGNATGRVDVIMLSNVKAVVIWMEPKGEEEYIMLRTVTDQENLGVPVTVSKTSAERAAGFPQIEKVGDTLYIAWTLTSKEGTAIEMASVSLSEL